MNILKCLVLSLFIVGCGDVSPPGRVQTVSDETYVLDVVKDKQESFYFRVCKELESGREYSERSELESGKEYSERSELESGREYSERSELESGREYSEQSELESGKEYSEQSELKQKIGGAELEETLQANAKAHCFNPFYQKGGGETAYLVAVPAVGNLRDKGVAKKTLRYVTKTGLITAFGALALILIPKAGKMVLAALFSMKKNGDEVAKRAILYQSMLTKAKGKRVPEERLRKIRKNFKLLESRPMRFLVSLFVIDGVVMGWGFAYDGYNSLDTKLNEAEWGEKELNLARAYPYLGSAQVHRVSDLQEILQVLRVHLDLVFSNEYLNEFESSPES